MESTQVKHIVDNILLDEPSDNGYTALLNNFMIVLNKDELLYTDINRWRYKLDYTNGLIKRILVKQYSHDISKVPSHNNYDVYYDQNHQPTVYEYITDRSGHIISDIYMMQTIVMFIPQPEVVL